MEKIILGIETSCDDTSVALIRGRTDNRNRPTVLAHRTFSQNQMVERWGGVVPEIAARNHLDKMVPTLKLVFEEAKLSPENIDLIGVTTFPGLKGPLLTGVGAAKTLALLYRKPIVAVNHLFAHLEAIHLTDEVTYPYMGMLVSGGHSIYFQVSSCDNFELIGSTIDDAAGEAFDKGGKILEIGYPAGQIIDKLAKNGDKNKIHFPIGLIKTKNPNLSFSGVKTSLRTYCEQNPSFKEQLPDICASYQEAIVSALVKKLGFALKKSGKMPIVIGGGVACNSRLREVLKEKYKNSYFVKPKFCTDNGAMIANYALRTYQSQLSFPNCLNIDVKSRYIDKKTFKKRATK